MLDKLNIAHFIDVRRRIHQNPELAFEEFSTAAFIAEELQAAGIHQLATKIAQTGIVATLKKGTGNKKIMLRADMDALPLQEANTFAHRSRNPMRMHACGHDGHVATLLCAMAYLAQYGQFDGTVYALFQPAEEHGGGAQKMLEAGLLETYQPDYVFALHNWPDLPVGHFGLKAGALMASSNEFQIHISGKGGHAAIPQQSNDPLLTATHLIQGLQTIVSRNVPPLDAVVLSVTHLNAQSASNIILDEVIFGGTVRTFDSQLTQLVEDKMRTMAMHYAQAHGCSAQVHFQRNYPPTVNHAQACALLDASLTKHFGTSRIHTNVTPTMGAEDFAFILEKAIGAYFFLGNGDGQSHHSSGLGPCQLHNPHYDFNDALIEHGASAWIHLVEDYLC